MGVLYVYCDDFYACDFYANACDDIIFGILVAIGAFCLSNCGITSSEFV